MSAIIYGEWQHDHQACRSRAEHGTTAGYAHHYSRNEAACRGCLDAASQYRKPSQAANSRVELAIAQGWPTARIMAELGVEYGVVKAARDRMAS